MSRYIDAEKVAEELSKVPWYKREDEKQAVRMVKEFPAADVQEVKHGRWEEHIINNIYCEGGVAIRLACPVCGECFTVTREARPRERFCRWCGAKMDDGMGTVDPRDRDRNICMSNEEE